MKKLLLLLTMMAGCKQGQGERCQVNDDCASPYTCNQAKQQCQGPSNSNEDAEVIDAPKTTPDATVADSAIDDAPNDAVAADAPTD